MATPIPKQAGQDDQHEQQALYQPTNSMWPIPPRAVLQVPTQVSQHFTQIDGIHYHLASGTRAFTADSWLRTTMHSSSVVSALFEVMRANEVRTIGASGSTEFMEHVWHSALDAGLAVNAPRALRTERVGFVPQPRPDIYEQLSSAAADYAHQQFVTAASTPYNDRPPIVHPTPASELITAVMLGAGAAREYWVSHRQPSFYLAYRVGLAEHTLWDPDLERAVRHGTTKPLPGDTIGMRALTKAQLYRDPRALLVEPNPPLHGWTHWIVEKQSFFSTRTDMAAMFWDRNIPSNEALAQYPELMGAYGTLLAVGEAALHKLRTPEDQWRWVNAIRDALAVRIARGDPMPQLPLDVTLGRAARQFVDPTKGDPQLYRLLTQDLTR